MWKNILLAVLAVDFLKRKNFLSGGSETAGETAGAIGCGCLVVMAIALELILKACSSS